MILYYKTDFQLINALSIDNFIKRRLHYEMLCDYIKQRPANRLGSRATQLPAPTATNLWRGRNERISRHLLPSTTPSLSSVDDRVAVALLLR